MKPINKHLQIEPVTSTDFVASQKGLYEEIGTVVAVGDGVDIPVGSKVYFESWLAKKFPIPGETNKYHWFVPYDDIVAYETLPE